MQPAVCEENSGVSVDGPGADTTCSEAQRLNDNTDMCCISVQ